MAGIVKDSVGGVEDALEGIIPQSQKGFQEGNDKYEMYDINLFEEEEEKRRDPENVNFIYCLVFNCKEKKPGGIVNAIKGCCTEIPVVTEKELELKRIAILKKIEEAGFITQSVYSSTKDQIIVKVGATDSRLLTEAELREHKLELNSVSLKRVLELTIKDEEPGAEVDKPKQPIYMDYANYDQEQFEKILYQAGEGTLPIFRKRELLTGTLTTEPVSLASAKSSFLSQCKQDPFKHIHFKYDKDWEEKIAREHKVQLYKKYRDGTILRTTDRIDLLCVALARDDTARKGTKGAGLNLRNLQYQKEILAHYPLGFNNQIRRAANLDQDEIYDKFFTKTCCGLGCPIPFFQPVQDVRDFCGEKIAYYFAFLEFYSRWLLISAVVGIVMFTGQIINMNNQLGAIDILNPIRVRVTDIGTGVNDLTNITEIREFLEENADGGEFINDRTPLAFSQNGTLALFVLTPTEIQYVIPVFSAFVAFWGSFFLEFWKRRQSTLAFKWGVSEFEATAQIRPEFKSLYDIPDAVSGLPTPYRSFFRFGGSLVFSATSMLTLVGVTVAAFTATYAFKAFMSNNDFLDPVIAVQVALVINAMVIIFLGKVFKKIGKVLTDWENHRTDIEYEDQLILKIFVFSFFNSYTTLLYFAFIKSGTQLAGQEQYCSADLEEFEANDNEASDLPGARSFDAEQLFLVDSCFGALGYSLIIIFFSQIVVNNSMEIGFPLLGNLLKRLSNIKAVKSGREENIDKGPGGEQKVEEVDPETVDKKRLPLKSPAERQFLLSAYNTPFYDYLELALQFGYVTLFVAAFPLAPLLALVNNFIEVWVDANIVFKQSRRPTVQRAQDIGSWYKVFETLSYISIVTNAAVLVFTSVEIVPLDPARDDLRVWAFLIFIIGVFTIKYLLDLIILDVPGRIRVMLKRQEFFEQKIFFDTEDDMDKFAAKIAEDVDDENQAIEDAKKFMPLLFDPDMDNLVDEVKEKMKKLNVSPDDIFNRINKDNSDNINLRELKNALESSEYGIGEEVEPQVIAHFVNALDLDGDGKISQKELAAFLDDSLEDQV